MRAYCIASLGIKSDGRDNSWKGEAELVQELVQEQEQQQVGYMHQVNEATISVKAAAG